MKKIILIHGWKGTPESGWRPWLKKELEKRGFSVFVPAMPDTNNPKMNEWVKHLAKIVGTPDNNCYFVGHSLGCITILRYLENMSPTSVFEMASRTKCTARSHLETLKKNQEIGGAVLVAGRSYSLGRKETKTFYETPLDWEKIRIHCKRFIAIHSDNDPYVPLSEADVFREKLSSEIIIKPGMKHFTGEEGVTELPAALDAVLKISCASH